MSIQRVTQTQIGKTAVSPAPSRLLQRQCACGNYTPVGAECDECHKKRLGLQRWAVGSIESTTISPIVHEVLRSPGQPLDPATRAFMEPRFEHDFSGVRVHNSALPATSTGLTINPPGDRYEQEADRVADTVMRKPEPATTPDSKLGGGYDFSQVRVHSDQAAARAAWEVNANAYTVGHNIVFGAGQFAPATPEGRRLIAHELAHVLQQSGSSGIRGGQSKENRGLSPIIATVQRQPKTGSKDVDPGKSAAPKSTAATAPKLDLTPSKNGPPCACLIVIHNNERNALKTAELMHANCAYNLTLMNSGTTSREIKIPGQKKTIDPNSLFPREIAAKCLDNEQSCRDFLKNKSGTTDPDEIEQFVQIQFFLAVSDCSKGFSLPVVALHNNDIEDTKNYLKAKDKQGVGDLKLDVDKSNKQTGDDQIKKLKDLIKKKFGDSVETEMMETAGKTNIFRWCASKDLSRCHIGDPDHPDNVTWVTNERDFTALSKKDINVAWQSEIPTSGNSESKGDLSTLFLLLKDILNVRLPNVIKTLEQKQEADWKEIDKIFDELERLAEFNDQTIGNTLDRLIEILRLLIDILFNKLLLVILPAATRARIEKLRFINIESPGHKLSDQTDAERVRNYEAIVEVLKTTGLHCCGDDPKKAEGNIKERLKEK